MTRQIWNPICWLWNTCRKEMCTLIISGASCTPPPAISYTNRTGYYICLKLNHEKWRLDLKNFNKDKLLLSLNQGMLIAAFIRVTADNVNLARGSYFAIKHLHSNDFIIAYTGCQRQTNWAAAPFSQTLPFKSAGKLYQLSAHSAFIKLAQWQARAHHNEMSIAWRVCI